MEWRFTQDAFGDGESEQCLQTVAPGGSTVDIRHDFAQS